MLESWQPRALSLLRFMSGLLLLQHGCLKLLDFPGPHPATVVLGNLMWFGGLIELVCGVLLVLGLFTRYAAFLAAGFTAVAYWGWHYPRGIYPILNGGEVAALYSFVFLYLTAAGGGPISVDAKRGAA